MVPFSSVKPNLQIKQSSSLIIKQYKTSSRRFPTRLSFSSLFIFLCSSVRIVMGGEDTWRTTIALVPPMTALVNQNAEKEDEQWSSNFNNSVNAMYMGFVATAILISMFIVMAIFERFFRRPRTASQLSDSAQIHFNYDNNPKLDHDSSKVSIKYSQYNIGLQIASISKFPSFLFLLSEVTKSSFE